MSQDYETVTVEHDDGVTTVTLNRPEKKNAMSPTLHEEMCEVMSDLKQASMDPDDGTDVLVLTGEGDSFCAGQDLEERYLENIDEPHRDFYHSRLSSEWGTTLRYFPSPTIAAVNGWVVGGGVRVSAICDLAVASERAKFCLSEVNFGVIPAGGSTQATAHVLQPRDALYMALTGEVIKAEQAEEMRLVNKTVPHDELYDEVYRIAERINGMDPFVTKMTKAVYHTEQELGMPYRLAQHPFHGYEAGADSFAKTLSPSYQDALQAFADDRFTPGESETFPGNE